jgi:hypothetical protein
MRSRNKEEDMAENRHLWRLGTDRLLLAVKILIIEKIYSVRIYAVGVQRMKAMVVVVLMKYTNTPELIE